MNETKTIVRAGDVLEFSLHGARTTAEAMLVTDEGFALLDLFDGDRPAWARVDTLDDVAVFVDDASEQFAVA